MSIEKKILVLFLGLVFIVSLLIVNSYFPFLSFNPQKKNGNISPPPSGNLTVYILDVGQGDSALVVSPNGTTMLIDAGSNGKGTGVVLPYLKGLGVTQLNYVVASHYHADHIGGIDEVIKGGISLTGLAYDRGRSYSSQTYNDYVAAVGSKRTMITDGQIINLGGEAKAKCVAVNGNGVLGASNENDLCVALVISYGDFDYFTAGDLSGKTTSSYIDIETSVAPEVGDIEVYKVNHHGSRYSTSQYLVDIIKPEVSVFSLGNDNDYGHPTQEVIDRLAAADSYMYLTEEPPPEGGSVPPGKGEVVNGHIVITTDGVGDYTVNGDWYATDNTTAQVITVTHAENETMAICIFLSYKNPTMILRKRVS